MPNLGSLYRFLVDLLLIHTIDLVFLNAALINEETEILVLRRN